MNTTDEAAIKAEVRERDGYRCVKCSKTNAEQLAESGDSLDVHRIVPGSEYSLEGCITVCRSCHGKLPKWKGGQPRETTIPVSLKLAPKDYRNLRIAASLHGVPMSIFVQWVISQIAEQVVDAEFGPFSKRGKALREAEASP